MALAIAGTSALVSCSDDDDDYVGAPESQGAFFPKGMDTTFDEILPEDDTFEVTIMRTNTSAAETFALEYDDESGLFTVPASVSFPAGQDLASIPVTFNGSDLEPQDYEITITISEAGAYVYGDNQVTITAGLASEYRWASIGTAELYDFWLIDGPWECEIQQHVVNTTQFRVKSPYQEAVEYYGAANSATPASQYIYFQVLQKGETCLGQKISLSNLVYFKSYSSGYYIEDYGAVVGVYFPGEISSSYATEDTWTHNKVLSYQENGLPNAVQFAPYYYMSGVGGWNKTQEDGYIYIVFPGGVLSDYSAEVAVTEVNTPADAEATVTANITLGNDVTSARVAIVAGNDPEGANDAVVAGSVDYTEITASGEVTLTMPEEAISGQYLLVVSTYSGKNAQEYAYDTFTYVLACDWEYVCTGTYTYDLFFGEGAEDPGLEVYVSSAEPDLYKITNWGYGVDFYFNMDENNFITVWDQFTGYNHPNYGAVFIDDLVDYYGTTGYGISFYKSGIFNFNVVYYVSAGKFGSGYETFTVTSWDQDEAAQSPKRAPAKSMLPVKNQYQNIDKRSLRLSNPMPLINE